MIYRLRKEKRPAMASQEAAVILDCTLAYGHGIYHMTGSWQSKNKRLAWTDGGYQGEYNILRGRRTDDQEPDPEQQRRDMNGQIHSE